jgi:uncharacterized protein YndB with AHSA1/START domain
MPSRSSLVLVGVGIIERRVRPQQLVRFERRRRSNVKVHSMASVDVRARVSIDLDADPQTVFDAWVVPSVMERWLFKSHGNSLAATTHPVPGGTYSITEHSAGRVIAHSGTYSVVEVPRRLAFSLNVPQHFTGEAQIEVTIVPEGPRTRLELVARGAGPDDAQAIWQEMLSNLAAVVRRDGKNEERGA